MRWGSGLGRRWRPSTWGAKTGSRSGWRRCGAGCGRRGCGAGRGSGGGQRRERKAHLGELVQMDGSFHDWLEGRGSGGCRMNRVDDATGTTLCRLGEEETIWAAGGVLRAGIERYGVPRAL